MTEKRVVADIAYEETGMSPDKVRELAVWQARSLLLSWRARFGDAIGKDTPVSKQYSRKDGGQIVVDSPTDVLVKLVHTTDERTVTYDFDYSASSLVITDTDSQEANADPSNAAYDRFARLIYDCDRSEARGENAPDK